MACIVAVTSLIAKEMFMVYAHRRNYPIPMFEGSINPLEKSLLITSDLKLTVSLLNCFCEFNDVERCQLDNPGH